MKKLILFLILAQSSFALAVDRNFVKRESGAFIGVGFGYSSLSLTPVNQSRSTFTGWNGSLEGGFIFGFTDTFGAVVSAEYKLTDSTNTIASSTYMEKANFNQINGKAGFYWGAFTFGGGVSKTSVDVKNVSSTTIGQTQTYTGTPKLYFLNYGFEKGNMRAALEAEYTSGNINSNIKYRDISGGVKFYFLF